MKQCSDVIPATWHLWDIPSGLVVMLGQATVWSRVSIALLSHSGLMPTQYLRIRHDSHLLVHTYSSQITVFRCHLALCSFNSVHLTGDSNSCRITRDFAIFLTSICESW